MSSNDWAATSPARGPSRASTVKIASSLLPITVDRSHESSSPSTAPGYRRHVELERAELERLAGAIGARPLIFTCWGFWTGANQLPEVIEEMSKIRSRAERIAARAATGLG